VDLYIHSPIRLHGVVLNYLSTGTTFIGFGVLEGVQVALWILYLFLAHVILRESCHLLSHGWSLLWISALVLLLTLSALLEEGDLTTAPWANRAALEMHFV
jgi:hypothetical protein